jgi:hypothetical protein
LDERLKSQVDHLDHENKEKKLFLDQRNQNITNAIPKNIKNNFLANLFDQQCIDSDEEFLPNRVSKPQKRSQIIYTDEQQQEQQRKKNCYNNDVEMASEDDGFDDSPDNFTSFKSDKETFEQFSFRVHSAVRKANRNGIKILNTSNLHKAILSMSTI